MNSSRATRYSSGCGSLCLPPVTVMNFFGPGGGIVSGLALFKRHDFVGFAVADQQRAVVVLDFAERIHARRQQHVHGQQGRRMLAPPPATT